MLSSSSNVVDYTLNKPPQNTYFGVLTKLLWYTNFGFLSKHVTHWLSGEKGIRYRREQSR